MFIHFLAAHNAVAVNSQDLFAWEFFVGSLWFGIYRAQQKVVGEREKKREKASK